MRSAAEIVADSLASVLEKVGTSAGVKRGWKTRKGELPPVAETPGGSPKKKKDIPKGYKKGKKGKAPKTRRGMKAPPEMAAEPLVAEETPGGKKPKMTQEGMEAVAQGAKASDAADQAAKIDGPEAKKKATEARRLAQSAKQRAGKGKTEDAQALSARARKVAQEAIAAAKESQAKKGEPAKKPPAAPPGKPPAEPPAAPPAEEPGEPPEGRPGTTPEQQQENVRVAQQRVGESAGWIKDVLDPGFKPAHADAAKATDSARKAHVEGKDLAAQAQQAADAGDLDKASRLASRARDALLDAESSAIGARSSLAKDAPEVQRSAHMGIQSGEARLQAAEKAVGPRPSLYLRHLSRQAREAHAEAKRHYAAKDYHRADAAAHKAIQSTEDIHRHMTFGRTAEAAERAYRHQPAIHDARGALASLRGRAAGASPQQIADLADEAQEHGSAIGSQLAKAGKDGSLPAKDVEFWTGHLREADKSAQWARDLAASGDMEGAEFRFQNAQSRYTAVASEAEAALVRGQVSGIKGSVDELHDGQVEEFTDLARQLQDAIAGGEGLTEQLRQHFSDSRKQPILDVPGDKPGARGKAMVKDATALSKDVKKQKAEAKKAAKEARGGSAGSSQRRALWDSQRRFDSTMREVSSMWRDLLNKLERAEAEAVGAKSLAEGDMADRNHAEEIVKGAMAKASADRGVKKTIRLDWLEKVGTSEGAARGWETRRGRAAVEETPGEGRGPSLEEQETPVAVGPEPETEELEPTGEAREILPTEPPSPELEEMDTPVAADPEAETPELPRTPEGPPDEPPAAPPVAEGAGEPTPRGVQGLVSHLEGFASEFEEQPPPAEGPMRGDPGRDRHLRMMRQMEVMEEAGRWASKLGAEVGADHPAAQHLAAVQDHAKRGPEGYQGAVESAKAAAAALGGEAPAEPEAPGRDEERVASAVMGAPSEGSELQEYRDLEDAYRDYDDAVSTPERHPETGARVNWDVVERITARAVVKLQEATSKIEERIRQLASDGHITPEWGEHLQSRIDTLEDAIYLEFPEPDDVRSAQSDVINELDEALSGDWDPPDTKGEKMKEKKSLPAGLSLGLGKFAKVSETREGRVEKAKAEMLEKDAVPQRGGGLFDALIPRSLRPGSKVAAPNPETHRTL